MRVFDINGTELVKGDLIIQAGSKYTIQIAVVKSLFYSKAYGKVTGISLSKSVGHRYSFSGSNKDGQIILSCLKYDGPNKLQHVIDWVIGEAWECELPKTTAYNTRVLANLTRAIDRAKIQMNRQKQGLYSRTRSGVPRIFEVKVITGENRGRCVRFNFHLTPQIELNIESTIESPTLVYDIPSFCQKFDVDIISVIERVDKIKEVLRNLGS